MSETEIGAVSGAGRGAMAGARVGGVWGAVIGGVIGGIAGGAAGRAAKRARIFRQRAARTQGMLQTVQAAIQRREMVRQTYVARAEQLAAASASGETGMLSSGYGGSMSSLMSRAGRNLQVFDASARDQVEINFWLKKAAKKSAQSSNILGLMDFAESATNFMGSTGMLGGGGGGGGSGGGSTGGSTGGS